MWQKCPVCEGKGRAPGGFYGDTGQLTVGEKCRTCKGKGVLLVPHPEPIYAKGTHWIPSDTTMNFTVHSASPIDVEQVVRRLQEVEAQR